MDILLEHPLSSILSLAILGLGAKRLLGGDNISKTPLPPSPPSQFILGHANILYQTDAKEEDVLHELGKQYGGIVYLNVLGVPIVVLNDIKITIDLLDKRGSVFSSRPKVTMMECMGYTQSLPALPYGPDWRINRRILQGYFNPSVRTLHQVVQLREARTLLQNVLLGSASEQGLGRDWEPAILRFSSAIIISSAFGHDITSEDDPYLKIADDIIHKVFPAIMVVDFLSAGLFQVFPFIQYLPSWFPGASVPSQARRIKPYVRALYEYPIKDMEEKMKAGKAQPSFLATQLEQFKDGEIGSEVTMDHIKGSSAAIYTAGAETTLSTLLTLLAALLLHPDVQKKAQAEIDKVVGTDRLPEYSDREKLPYLQCIIDEVQRWQPVIHLNPRKSTEDEVYEGMFIPKGTMVIANVRGMSCDESIYKDPSKFNPDRFLPVSEGGNGEPAFTFIFGAGRRICPGRWLAQDSLWIATAQLLATMNVLAVPGEEIKWKFMGTVNRPLPFKCQIVPRSDKARELVERVEF